MTKTIGRIAREGAVHFGDASLNVWEEGLHPQMTWNDRVAWERQFKHDVFKRIIQTLKRLGWTVQPQTYIRTGHNARFCQKGDLKGDLSICGRHIEFQMFQSVNCPTRPDHEGRYEWNKEAAMPYVIRLEMERTRRRIRDYLLNVFTGYTFDTKRRLFRNKPLQSTALQCIRRHYDESWHFKGDLSKYTISDYNRKSAEGAMLEHGQRVWFADHKGRICEGTAFYNINNMWWVVTGKYDYTNVASFDIYTRPPENIRVKRNERLRRKRLEELLAEATKSMNFERAVLLRDLLFPRGEPLFAVWHREHKAYHKTGFNGYTSDLTHAGKFTAAEVSRWNHAPNKIVPLAA